MCKIKKERKLFVKEVDYVNCVPSNLMAHYSVEWDQSLVLSQHLINYIKRNGALVVAVKNAVYQFHSISLLKWKTLIESDKNYFFAKLRLFK